MKGEIDENFYCSAGLFVSFEYSNSQCNGTRECSEKCQHKHRKHPTPEQYREEYGEEYPDDGAVWLFYKGCGEYSWSITDYCSAKLYNEQKKHPVICACAPWGKPPDTWRPE